MFCLYTLGLPVIDRGPFVPSVYTRGNKSVKIGTPVYSYYEYTIRIDCGVVNEIIPTTYSWIYYGGPYYNFRQSGGRTFIVDDDYYDGDYYECRADNLFGFDTARSTIHSRYSKYVYTVCHMHIFIIYCTYIQIHIYVSMCVSYTVFY